MKNPYQPVILTMVMVSMDKSKTTVALRHTGFWARKDRKMNIFRHRMSASIKFIS